MQNNRKNIIWTMLLAASIGMTACQSPEERELQSELQQAGDNHAELQAVIGHYDAQPAGRNALTITPDIADGYYVAYVWAGNHKFQAIIVK